MKNFVKLSDIDNLHDIIRKAILLKISPFDNKELGKNKTLVMLFFNSSLRTRLSTEKAAKNLGMDTMVLNVNDAWQLELEDGTIMDTNKSEHIKEAAKVISQYADFIAIRAFPGLIDKQLDNSEPIINAFLKYATVPIINMESATAHPLQSLADAITISEWTEKKRPKVVLSWAPHPKALPHAVANSFVEMMLNMDVEFTITHPHGYELNSSVVNGVKVVYNQEEALQNADFVYVKNWSSYNDYGKVLNVDSDWMMTDEKLKKAKFMHCLPVRRNVVVEDTVLDGEQSLVIEQANNRTFAAQVVLQELLLSNEP